MTKGFVAVLFFRLYVGDCVLGYLNVGLDGVVHFWLGFYNG